MERHTVYLCTTRAPYIFSVNVGERAVSHRSALNVAFVTFSMLGQITLFYVAKFLKAFTLLM